MSEFNMVKDNKQKLEFINEKKNDYNDSFFNPESSGDECTDDENIINKSNNSKRISNKKDCNENEINGEKDTLENLTIVKYNDDSMNNSLRETYNLKKIRINQILDEKYYIFKYNVNSTVKVNNKDLSGIYANKTKSNFFHERLNRSIVQMTSIIDNYKKFVIFLIFLNFIIFYFSSKNLTIGFVNDKLNNIGNYMYFVFSKIKI